MSNNSNHDNSGSAYYQMALAGLEIAKQHDRPSPPPAPPRHWPAQRRRKPLAGHHTGNVLYMTRVCSGLTQQALVNQAQLSRQTINGIENGRRAPSVYIAIRIAQALNLRVEDLFKVRPISSGGLSSR